MAKNERKKAGLHKEISSIFKGVVIPQIERNKESSIASQSDDTDYTVPSQSAEELQQNEVSESWQVAEDLPEADLVQQPNIEPVEETEPEPDEQPIAESVEGFETEPEEQPIAESVEDFETEPEEQPIAESVVESEPEPEEQPIAESVEDFETEPEEQPIAESVEESESESDEQPTIESVEDFETEPEEQPIVESVEDFESEREEQPIVESVEDFETEREEQPVVESMEETEPEREEQPIAESVEESEAEPDEEPRIEQPSRPKFLTAQESNVVPIEESDVEPAQESKVVPIEESDVEPAEETKDEPVEQSEDDSGWKSKFKKNKKTKAIQFQQKDKDEFESISKKSSKKPSVVQVSSSGTWKQITDKLFTPKPGESATKQKAMVIMIPLLFIALLIFVLKGGVFGTSAHKAKANEENNTSDTASTGSSTEIDWKIPEPYPTTLRDPVKLGSLVKSNNRTGSVSLAELRVRSILYSEDKSSAVIGSSIVHEGDEIGGGVKIIKINKDSVEFEMDGKRWTQQVQG